MVIYQQIFVKSKFAVSASKAEKIQRLSIGAYLEITYVLLALAFCLAFTLIKTAIDHPSCLQQSNRNYVTEEIKQQ